PSDPSIVMYPYEIKHTSAEPHGAAEIAVIADSPPVATTGFDGRNGTRCFATQIGPTPGPPPPCGIAKVLCRLRWQTSAPIVAGFLSPHLAFIFALFILT